MVQIVKSAHCTLARLSLLIGGKHGGTKTLVKCESDACRARPVRGKGLAHLNLFRAPLLVYPLSPVMRTGHTKEVVLNLEYQKKQARDLLRAILSVGMIQQ